MSTRIDLSFPLALIEFLARLGSVASIALLGLIFWGDAVHPSQISRTEWLGLVFFPIGITIGMVVAWWREGLGSAITLASLVAFYVVYGYIFKNHIGGWAFIVFASPGFLFLLHWFFRTLVKNTKWHNRERTA
jgi:hypothetical protein